MHAFRYLISMFYYLLISPLDKMVKTKRNKFDSGTFFFSLSFLPNVVCSYLLIFILLMFNIPMHASKNAVERNRSLFFSLFVQNQASQSCRGESNSSFTRTRIQRAPTSSRGPSPLFPRRKGHLFA